MKIEHRKTEKKNSLEVSGRHHLLRSPELFGAAAGWGRLRGRGEGAHSSSPKKLPASRRGLLGSPSAALSLLLLLQILPRKGSVRYTR